MSNTDGGSDRDDSGASHVQRGQTWSMNEARANPDDVPEPHDVELWAGQPSFRAVVDRVVDGVAELTVATGNDHPRTPGFGEKVDVSVERLKTDSRWKLKSGEGQLATVYVAPVRSRKDKVWHADPGCSHAADDMRGWPLERAESEGLDGCRYCVHSADQPENQNRSHYQSLVNASREESV